jgi:sialic acid synthase SpsE
MTKVIAEIGFNYIDDMGLCREMIQAAKESGAEYAKFQYFDTKHLKPGPWDTDGRREIYEKAQLANQWPGGLDEVKNLCQDVGIKFLCTGFSQRHIQTLKYSNRQTQFNSVVKIPSMESRNKELLKYSFQVFDNVFMSTGTSKFSELKANLKHTCQYFPTSQSGHRKKLILMHCVSSYPCEPSRANLPKINLLRELCEQTPGLEKFEIGYSDHCEGIEVAKQSLEYGVDWIEKHFTIDKNLPGRDNKFSILPDEMSELNNYIKTREETSKFLGKDYQYIESETRRDYTGRWDLKDE